MSHNPQANQDGREQRNAAAAAQPRAPAGEPSPLDTSMTPSQSAAPQAKSTSTQPAEKPTLTTGSQSSREADATVAKFGAFFSGGACVISAVLAVQSVYIGMTVFEGGMSLLAYGTAALAAVSCWAAFRVRRSFVKRAGELTQEPSK